MVDGPSLRPSAPPLLPPRSRPPRPPPPPPRHLFVAPAVASSRSLLSHDAASAAPSASVTAQSAHCEEEDVERAAARAGSAGCSAGRSAPLDLSLTAPCGSYCASRGCEDVEDAAVDAPLLTEDDATTRINTADTCCAAQQFSSSSCATANVPAPSRPQRSSHSGAPTTQNTAYRSAAAALAFTKEMPTEARWRKKCVSNIKAILRHFETTITRAEPSQDEFLHIRQFLKEGMDKFWRSHVARAIKKFRMQLPLKPLSPIWEVLPFLYLGGKDAAENATLLQRTGITHIINCSPTVISRPAKLVKVKYIELFMEDTITSDAIEFIPAALAMVKDARDSGRKCFIHCFQGVNRSVFLCIAAVLALGQEHIPDRIDKTDKGERSDSESSVDCEHAQRLLQAWMIVARARFAPPVLTNPPFLRQLYLWLRAGMDVSRTPHWEVMEFEWEKFTRGVIKTMLVARETADARSRNRGRKRKTTADALAQDQINARVWEQVLAGTVGPMNSLGTPEGLESLRSLIGGEIENETRRIMPEGVGKKPVKLLPPCE